MVGGLGKRYCIYLPDGSVEHLTLLGHSKLVEDTVKLRGRKWKVVHAVKLMGEEIDYELRVEPIEN